MPWQAQRETRNGRGKNHWTEKMSEETSKALEKMTPKNIPSIKLMQGGKEKGRGKEYFK